jgi:putative endonuclease
MAITPAQLAAMRAQRGRHAEDAAEAHLLGLGHEMLARNLRLGHLEVDLLSLDPHDGALVLTEVKARAGGRHAPELRVDRSKRRHLILAARVLLQRASFRRRAVRFDVIAVQLDPTGNSIDLRHIPRAFDANDG